MRLKTVGLDWRNSSLVIPGERLRSAEGLLRGHGTYEENGILYASIAGVVEVVDKLIYVRPLGHTKYYANIGDVVVGRIEEVCSDRWYVDIRGATRGHLQLSAVNFPNNEQRKRCPEDQFDMRKYYQEGDCACLEVQRLTNDGTVQLQVRSAKYGTLRNGSLIIVPQVLVKRQPNHMVELKCGVSIVLGMNGMIWVGCPTRSTAESLNFASVCSEEIVVPLDMREKISRARNCILALSSVSLLISLTAPA